MPRPKLELTDEERRARQTAATRKWRAEHLELSRARQREYIRIKRAKGKKPIIEAVLDNMDALRQPTEAELKAIKELSKQPKQTACIDCFKLGRYIGSHATTKRVSDKQILEEEQVKEEGAEK